MRCYRYCAFGLTIASEFEIPILREKQAENYDIQIRQGQIQIAGGVVCAGKEIVFRWH